MASPEPLELPTTLGFNSKVFDLNLLQQLSPSGRGYIQALDRTTPMWIAEYQTPGLRDHVYDAAISFLMRLDGSMNTFLGYDPRRPMPRAYQHMSIASDPWTGAGFDAPLVDDFDYEFSTISLSQMAPGAVITSGDYVSFKYLGIWYLFRAMSSAIADPSGGATIEVRPRPYMPDTFTSAEVRYRRACCEMKMIGRYEEKDNVEENPSFFFRAVQFINRSTDAATEEGYFWRTSAGALVADESGNVIRFGL